MMFLTDEEGPGELLAITQPAHAWVSGQLLHRWATPLPAPLLLACELHDLAWLDWERDPSFDPRTGLPHLFRDIGAAVHAPRWSEAVDRARAAWGTRVALLISRHGTVIFSRFTDRHRASDADADAAAAFLDGHAARQRAWAAELGLDQNRLHGQTALLALADTLSLGLCGGVDLPLHAEGAAADGTTVTYAMARAGHRTFTLAPWPFRDPAVTVTLEARRVPGGRFMDEAAMRAWLRTAAPLPLTLSLQPG